MEKAKRNEKNMAARVAAGPSLTYLRSYADPEMPSRLAELWSLEMPGKVDGKTEFEAYWDGVLPEAFAGWNLPDLVPSLRSRDLQKILDKVEPLGPQDKTFFKK